MLHAMLHLMYLDNNSYDIFIDKYIYVEKPDCIDCTLCSGFFRHQSASECRIESEKVTKRLQEEHRKLR